MGQLQIAAVIALVGLLIGFSAGWKVNGYKYEAERAMAEKSFVSAMEMTAKELAKIEVKNVTIRQELEKEIRTNAVYIDCKHTASSLQLINEAITGEPTGDSKLPKDNKAD